jgi:protein tyrosine/serine phosphatase
MTETQIHSRHLIWDGCLNVRDLGGLPTADGRVIHDGALVRSDHAGRLSVEGRAALIAHGVRTIIDLRTEVELERDPPAFRDESVGGVRYLHLPIFPHDEQFGAELRATTSAIEVYQLILDRWGEAVAAIVAAIARAPEGGVLIHCYSGKDRTGVIVALVLAVVGVPDDVIAADYALTDANLRDWYDEILAQTDDPGERRRLENQIFTSFPETILATLEYLEERYGGAEGYLKQAGVSVEVIELLRARLLQ